MAKKQKPEECKQKVAEYMLTYGDMMTLLLCFFVLLFSFSSIDAKKFEAIIQSFSGALGVLDGGTTVQDAPMLDSGLMDENTSSEVLEMQNFQKLEETIQEYLNENQLSESVTVLEEEAGLLLRFQDNILFDSGSADLKPESLEIMSYIAQLLNAEDFEDKFISIEGHTDNVPMNSPRYPSNWELSVVRSSNVVRFLVENNNMDPKRISASGYSEYHPVAPNDNAENRAKNRRVDILILKTIHYKDSSKNQ
jgi:chemotaxis protein MotB